MLVLALGLAETLHLYYACQSEMCSSFVLVNGRISFKLVSCLVSVYCCTFVFWLEEHTSACDRNG